MRTKAHPFNAERTLIDSRERYDASVLGYDGPRDPQEDGEGLIVTARIAGFDTIPTASLQGPDGCIELTGRSEIQAVIDALQVALASPAQTKRVA